jgi:hypothetical protein
LLALQDLNGIRSTFKVENRHRICVRVVVDHFVILIRADHLPKVGATMRLNLCPARPEACRLHEDLGTCR